MDITLAPSLDVTGAGTGTIHVGRGLLGLILLDVVHDTGVGVGVGVGAPLLRILGVGVHGHVAVGDTCVGRVGVGIVDRPGMVDENSGMMQYVHCGG